MQIRVHYDVTKLRNFSKSASLGSCVHRESSTIILNLSLELKLPAYVVYGFLNVNPAYEYTPPDVKLKCLQMSMCNSRLHYAQIWRDTLFSSVC